jgi:hypothetical protein
VPAELAVPWVNARAIRRIAKRLVRMLEDDGEEMIRVYREYADIVDLAREAKTLIIDVLVYLALNENEEPE